ncbi:MAG: NfeD family protein [Deltaproteobacteria bacterium]|nr:NfeD family protein [Deltaproteobacteria bacterium]
MVSNAIIILALGVLLFELMEHGVFPLIWFIKDRKRKSICGVTGMLGKVGEIRSWKASEGQVFVHGELWEAISEFPLSVGDPVVVKRVDRLVLIVVPEFSQTDPTTTSRRCV